MTFRIDFHQLPALLLFLIGFSISANAQNTITTQRVKGQKGCFTSPELDHLFNVNGRMYSYADLKLYNFKNHHVQLVKMHPVNLKDERSMLLLLNEQNQWTDTLSLKYLEDISFFVTLEGNREGICTGEFNFDEMKLYIERIFEVTPESRLVQVSNNTRITECPPVYEEGITKKEYEAVKEVFSYGIVPAHPGEKTSDKQLNQVIGEWRLTCHNNLTTLDISENNTAYISLDARTYINCDVSPDPDDSTAFLIAFREFSLDLPDLRSDYENSLADIASTIDQGQAIAKISALQDGKLWLEWYGLFDTELSEYRFQLNDLVFYTENNRERPIVLKRCM